MTMPDGYESVATDSTSRGGLGESTWVRLRPHLSVVPCGPDRVILRSGLWSGQNFSLADEGKKGKLSSLVMRLQSGCTVGQLVAEFGEQSDADIQNLLRQLKDHLLLDVFARKPDRFQEGLQLASSFGARAGEELLTRVTSRRVVLWGLGGIGQRLAFQCARLRVGELVLVDDASFSLDESPYVTGVVEEAGLTRAAATARALSVAFPNLSVVEAPVDSLGRFLDPARTHLVVALEAPDIGRLRRANELALLSGTQWTAAVIDGTEVMVGPTFVPGQSACYACFELRLEGNLLDYDGYRAHRDQLLTVGCGPSRGHPAALLDLAAGYVGYDLFRLLALGHGLTQGRLIRLNATYGAVEQSDVLRLPRCPICGKPARSRPNTAVFTTLEQVAQELGV